MQYNKSQSEMDTFHTSQLAHNLQTHSLEYTVYSTQSNSTQVNIVLYESSFSVPYVTKGAMVMYGTLELLPAFIHCKNHNIHKSCMISLLSGCLLYGL